ncbi:MAG: tRNA pseudouridine(13) synthase TruD [Planctomycetes bacterium]|nr:tRNA pseudouridine(13) synthase TruD [Planctomycetota bacterium]
MNHAEPFPHPGFLTADEPPLRGALKVEPEDFAVEEIPAYAASGAGTHLYLTIEKRGLTTRDAIRVLARELGRPERDFGYAGLKDARAVTRQRLSIEHVDPARVEGLDARGLRVLAIERHGNKLKPGHLRGNRFEILLRGADAHELERARRILARLAECGVPNAFGAQRFGRSAHGHRLGRALLCGEAATFTRLWLETPARGDDAATSRARELCAGGAHAEALADLPRALREERPLIEGLAAGLEPERAIRRLDLSLLRFFVSAWQAALFQSVLSRRLATCGTVSLGDVAYLHRNGACFLVEDELAEAPRARAFEISPSGPLFGTALLRAQGEPGALEAEVFAEEGLDDAALAAAGKLAPSGERRPLRFALGDPRVEVDPAGLRFWFTLAPGCYATTVLGELTKDPGSLRSELPELG